MPIYEYECKKCGNVVSELHGINEKPELTCESCGSKSFQKLVSSFSFKMGDTNEQRKFIDTNKRHNDIKYDLKTNYGVEKIKPLKNTSLEKIYKDVKAAGNSVNESMAQQKEMNAKRTREKQKEWMKGALKRTPARAKLRQEMKKKEEYNKRKIDL